MNYKWQGKKFSIDHFNAEKISRRNTFKNLIKRAKNDSGRKRIKGISRVAKIINPQGHQASENHV